MPLPLARAEWFVASAELVATVIEAVGILVILLGGLWALGRYGFDAFEHTPRAAYRHVRRRLGRAILLGLEFLVAADIIATVLVDPTLRGAAALALIVLIRTFLSWSLELEIDGRWPWQKEEKPAHTPA